MPADIIADQEVITRSLLYELVWQHDVKAIASRCGFTDVYLHKLCRLWQIPKPGLGEWQKIRAGHRLRRSALQRWADSDSDPAVLHRHGDRFSGTAPSKPRASRAKTEEQRREEFLAMIEALQAEAAPKNKVNAARQARAEAAENLSASRNFALKVGELQWSYGMAVVDKSVMGGAAFDEHATLLIKCAVWSPTKLRGRLLDLRIWFHKEWNGEQRGWKLTKVGELFSSERALMLRLPQDSVPMILAGLTLGRQVWVKLSTTRVDRSYELVRSFEFTSVDPNKEE